MSFRLEDNVNLNGQTTAPDANYPDGSYKNDTTGISGDGTPTEKSQKDDVEGFLQALRLNSGIVASGIADTALVSDYLDALRLLGVYPYVDTLDYRVGDMARGSDGLAYQALVANGPDAIVVDPVKDVTGAWLMGLAKQRPASSLLYGGYGQVAQRGTVAGVGALTNEYTLDGVQIRTSGSPVARFTVSKGGNIPGQPGSVKIQTTTLDGTMAADDLVVVRMPIEAQDLQVLETGTAGVKKLGIRLVAAFPKAGIQPISIYNEDDSTSYPTEITVGAADTFEEFVFDIPGNPAGTIDNDTGAGLWLCIPLLAGTNFQGAADAWQAGEKYATANQQNQVDGTPNITEFIAKAEVGDSTPFATVPFPEALARAQRYWRPVRLANAGTISAGNGFNLAVPVPPFRVAPVIENQVIISQTNFTTNPPTLSVSGTDFLIMSSGAGPDATGGFILDVSGEAQAEM